jgi:hypothetical protein
MSKVVERTAAAARRAATSIVEIIPFRLISFWKNVDDAIAEVFTAREFDVLPAI